MFRWGHDQQRAFNNIKEELSSPPGLALYNAKVETVVSADASSFGLGAVLLQRQEEGHLKPVAYSSRSLTDTEKRYAQIEKEALAITWSCKCFSDYLVGIRFHVETDHKPLVPLLGSKSLDELPPRIQRLRMRLMAFCYSISHVAGNNLATADVLSRAPLREKEVNMYVNMDITMYVNRYLNRFRGETGAQHNSHGPLNPPFPHDEFSPSIILLHSNYSTHFPHNGTLMHLQLA
jgi:hypothetical protein